MMDLYVETLTGTAFELRVSPFETVLAVKNKIQKFEGIPTSQQHLIWQNVELTDDYCLRDYNIHNGATLKLVLSMRGGPINTRRIPMEDSSLRDMAEYAEAAGKEGSNRQVTLLVFREGDQLNFFRVVDKGDGTLTPLSESLSASAASMYNLCEEEEEVDTVLQERREDNARIREKIQLLKTKMDGGSKKGRAAEGRSEASSAVTTMSGIEPHPPLASAKSAALSATSAKSALSNVSTITDSGATAADPPGAVGGLSLRHAHPQLHRQSSTSLSALSKKCLPPVSGAASATSHATGSAASSISKRVGTPSANAATAVHPPAASSSIYWPTASVEEECEVVDVMPRSSSRSADPRHHHHQLSGAVSATARGSSASRRLRRASNIQDYCELEASVSGLALHDSALEAAGAASASAEEIFSITAADAAAASLLSSATSPSALSGTLASRRGANNGTSSLTRSGTHLYSVGPSSAGASSGTEASRKKSLTLDTIKESLKTPITPSSAATGTLIAPQPSAPSSQTPVPISEHRVRRSSSIVDDSESIHLRHRHHAGSTTSSASTQHGPSGGSGYTSTQHGPGGGSGYASYLARREQKAAAVLEKAEREGNEGYSGGSAGSGSSSAHRYHHHHGHHHYNQSGSRLHHHYPGTKRLELESLSPPEAQAMSDLLQQASLERLGTFVYPSSNATSGPSPVKSVANQGAGSSSLRYHPVGGKIITPDSGRHVSSRLLDHYEDRTGLSELSGGLPAVTRAGGVPGIGAAAKIPLPPVKSKKSSSKRCFVCSKKTGLATSYPCRCGNNFCSVHRYAEAHECTFDYKTEGRKILEQNNPVVSAPKLPKI